MYIREATDTAPQLELILTASARPYRFTITIDLPEQKRWLRIANASVANFPSIERAINRLSAGEF